MWRGQDRQPGDLRGWAQGGARGPSTGIRLGDPSGCTGQPKLPSWQCRQGLDASLASAHADSIVKCPRSRHHTQRAGMSLWLSEDPSPIDREGTMQPGQCSLPQSKVLALTGDDFAPRGTGNVWTHFGLSQLGGGVLLASSGDTVNQPTVHRTAPSPGHRIIQPKRP